MRIRLHLNGKSVEFTAGPLPGQQLKAVEAEAAKLISGAPFAHFLPGSLTAGEVAVGEHHGLWYVLRSAHGRKS